MKLNEEENKQITEKLALKYSLQIPRDVVASAFTSHPKLPVLLSRASFRPDADIRTQQRTRFQRDRRNVLRGMLGLAALSVSALTLAEIGSALSQPAQTTVTESSVAAQTPTAASNPPSQANRLVANASNIPPNQSLSLNDPTFGPMLLIHLDNGQFVAYSSICTHAGCQVQFDPSFKDIACPCHGAAYDPYHNAQVINGPAPYPLQKIPIQYDTSTGNIYLTG